MEFYLADNTFQPISVIDDQVSTIWTERYVGPGDFQLVTANYKPFLSYLQSATPYYLRRSGSKQLMQLETISKNKGDDTATISGRTLDAFFENRDSRKYGAGSTESYSASVMDILQKIVAEYCCTAGVDQIPGLDSSTSWGGTVVSMSVNRDTVLNMITNVANSASLGWTLETYGTNSVSFLAVQSEDWSNENDPVNYIELSKNSEILSEPSGVLSLANYKTEARVIGAKTSVSVYANGVSSITGWQRRTVVVQATNIGTDNTTTVAQDQAVLRLLGIQALADQANAYAKTVDGTVTALPSRVRLGDIVAMSDGDLIADPIPARISEMVYSQDVNGFQATPSFTMLQSAS